MPPSQLKNSSRNADHRKNRTNHSNVSQKSLRREKDNDHTIIYGLHPVEAALRNPRRKIHRLILTDNGLQRLNATINIPGHIPVETLSASRLSKMVEDDATHQGILLEASPLPYAELSDFLVANKTPPLFVALDQITDPHNVGAIFRSMAAFGATALITTWRHAPAQTPVLAKAASGALDMVPWIRVHNLVRAVSQLQDFNILTVGLAGEAGTDIRDLFAAQHENRAQGLSLILGAEGKGLRQATRSQVDKLVRLQMSPKMPSINVSNAAAIALFVLSEKK